MPRPAKYSVDTILDAAALAVHEHGVDATIAQVASVVGAPTGSIYHRFASREALFGALWARSIRRFHVGLLEAATCADPREAMAGLAVHIPRFCRDHPLDAKAMTLYRLTDLLAALPPTAHGGLADINVEVDASLREVTRRRYGHVDDGLFRLAVLGTRQCPYGLVRPVVGAEVPADLDAICIAAAEGILALGDRPRSATSPRPRGGR